MWFVIWVGEGWRGLVHGSHLSLVRSRSGDRRLSRACDFSLTSAAGEFICARVTTVYNELLPLILYYYIVLLLRYCETILCLDYSIVSYKLHDSGIVVVIVVAQCILKDTMCCALWRFLCSGMTHGYLLQFFLLLLTLLQVSLIHFTIYTHLETVLRKISGASICTFSFNMFNCI